MRAPAALGCVLYYRRNWRVELPIAGSSGCFRIDLARTNVDGVLIDLCERGSAEIADNLIEKPLAATVLQIAQRGFREAHRSATTVDSLGEDFGLALCPDFIRDFLVVSSSAFFNADSPDGAPDDPIRRFRSENEAEGHGRTS